MAKMIDFTGKLYGDWRILHREGNRGNFVSWLAECKCGTKKILVSSHISCGIAKKNCGCDSSWIGKKFGKLLVKEKIGDKGNHASEILCICDCGKEKKIWGGSLHAGSVTSCGCKRRRSSDFKSITVIMGSYLSKTRRLKQEFSLTREEFENLIGLNCFYCGSEPSNKFKRKPKNKEEYYLTYNGIDRVNNSKGYTLENCVTCCKKCNLMKRDLEVQDWLLHMKKILENQPAAVGG